MSLNIASSAGRRPSTSRLRLADPVWRSAMTLAAAALALAGCQYETDSTTSGAEEEVGVAESAVANGTVVPNPENSTMVWISTPGISLCSGSLLTNDWILTASHCNPMSVAANTISVTMGNAGSPNAQTRMAVFRVQHPSLDFALIRVGQPFTVNGSTTGFKRGFYEGTTGSLTGKLLTGYGYSSGVCNGCNDFGTLRSLNVIPNGSYDKYNYNYGSVNPNQYIVAGDSGGGGFRTTAAGTFLAGVTKNGGMFQLPENFRDWVTSYIYGRPIQIPTTWFLPNAIVPYLNGARLPAGPFPGLKEQYAQGNVEMWSRPLPNGYDVKARWWDPCPDGTYTWSATFDMENYWDWIDVATDDPLNPGQLKVTRLTGAGGAVNDITGSGYVWVDVHTDGSVVSQGMNSMAFVCKKGPELSNPFPSPLPNNYTQTAAPWEPCPGGDELTWTASYQFQAGDWAEIMYDLNPEFPDPVVTQLRGSGTLSGTSYGPTNISVFTDGASQSVGITSLTAECKMALECHGARCFTMPDRLPNSSGPGIHRTVTRSWNPCNGGGFTWTARHNLESCLNCDYGKVGNTTFTGWNGQTSGTSAGPTTVSISTDESVTSTGFDVSAVCNSWSSSP